MQDDLKGMKRTHRCTAVCDDDVGREVTLMGWVNKRRDHGGVIFCDIRDISGIIQAVFEHETLDGEAFKKAEHIRSEYVIAIRGNVRFRDEERINPNLKTGHIEVVVHELRILSEAQTPPIYIEEGLDTNESVRLRYRYLDLRRPDMQANLILRHKAAQVTRRFFDENDFLEIETPVLTKSTPEGARDYLVPSRVHKGMFYALPQSPQLFKQLLMVAGYDKYFQIVKCFRDEDLRADRQPEFTQIDVEMSFVDVEDVLAVNERLLKKLFKETINVDVNLPIKRITYEEAMQRYGSDKPDTRFGLELVDLSDILKDCGFKVFADAIAKGGSVRAINAKGCGRKLSRREIDALGESVKTYGAKGMAWINVDEDSLKSPIIKFLSQETVDALLARVEAKPGDLILFAADTNDVVFASLGFLRLEIAKKLDMLDPSHFEFVWVTQFPLLEYDDDEKRWSAKHHPFTSPMDEDISLLDTRPQDVRAKAYDIVLNGCEIGGGSIRIYDSTLQNRMFNLLGFSDESARERFGFLLDAFKYGTPPHGGIAYGFDRIIMLMTKSQSIRDVIAFPKVKDASCLMTQAPSVVDDKQLKELGIKIRE
jgi:aspartyl-tRNA synthetase